MTNKYAKQQLLHALQMLEDCGITVQAHYWERTQPIKNLAVYRCGYPALDKNGELIGGFEQITIDNISVLENVEDESRKHHFKKYFFDFKPQNYKLQMPSILTSIGEYRSAGYGGPQGPEVTIESPRSKYRYTKFHICNNQNAIEIFRRIKRENRTSFLSNEYLPPLIVRRNSNGSFEITDKSIDDLVI